MYHRVAVSWIATSLLVALPVRELLTTRRAADSRVLVASRANHRLEMPAGPDEAGRWRFPRIAPEVLDALDEWIAGHFVEER